MPEETPPSETTKKVDQPKSSRGHAAGKAPAELAVDFAKSALWPSIALIALFLFYKPVDDTLVAIAKHSGEIQTVKLGGFEFDLHASELPIPTEDIVSALQGLDGDTVLTLLNLQTKTGGLCTPDGGQFKYLERLQDAGLIQFRALPVVNTDEYPEKGDPAPPSGAPNGAHCADIKLLPLGAKAQRFLAKFIAIEVTGIKSN